MQYQLYMDDHQLVMTIELDIVHEERIRALNSIMAQKTLLPRGYNKRVKHRSFDEGDLVWKTILPVGSKDTKFGKWFPK